MYRLWRDRERRWGHDSLPKQQDIISLRGVSTGSSFHGCFFLATFHRNRPTIYRPSLSLQPWASVLVCRQSLLPNVTEHLAGRCPFAVSSWGQPPLEWRQRQRFWFGMVNDVCYVPLEERTFSCCCRSHYIVIAWQLVMTNQKLIRREAESFSGCVCLWPWQKVRIPLVSNDHP